MMFSLHLHILLQLVFQVRKIISVCYFFFKSLVFIYYFILFIYIYPWWVFSCFSFSLFSQSAFYVRLATSSSGCKPLVFWRTSHKCVCVVSVLAELCEVRALDGCFTDTWSHNSCITHHFQAFTCNRFAGRVYFSAVVINHFTPGLSDWADLTMNLKTSNIPESWRVQCKKCVYLVKYCLSLAQRWW